ncbi:MAG: S41 family peptidase [Candidatus Nomurabacteria bacterium]
MIKNFSNKNLLRAVSLLVFVGLLFGSGILVGASVGATTYGADFQLDSPLFKQVVGSINEKFVFWKSSSTLPTSQELEYGVIKGYVASYKDPYTIFFPPKEAKSFTENVKGSFGGVGMNVGMKDGNIVVIAPLKDSPAMKAGILAGDIITAVEGTSTLQMSSDEAVNMIRGEIGTKVNLTVLHKNAKAVSKISVIRQEIKIPTLDTEKKNGVFVIHLYNFSAESPELFRKALNEFMTTGLKYMVIDLRGNPGGYLEAAVNMASYFLKEGQVIVSEKYGKTEETKDHRSTGIAGIPVTTKIVVMVDGGSASASEILAGALKDHDIAKIVGEKSFGKGSVQELINYDDGSSLKVTIAKWYTPKGVNISESGIKPDVEVAVATTTPKGYKGTYDSQLLKAIEVVKR